VNGGNLDDALKLAGKDDSIIGGRQFESLKADRSSSLCDWMILSFARTCYLPVFMRPESPAKIGIDQPAESR
jgi:hypothetical protein